MNNPTQFEEIYRMFLNSISNDYHLKKILIDSPEIAQDMMLTWLKQSIAKFRECQYNLEDNIDFINMVFGVSLNLEEKSILTDLMVYHWLSYNINNVVQMNLSVQDRDYKTHSADRNLSGKVEYQDRLREKIYHDISEYCKKLYPISSWAMG